MASPDPEQSHMTIRQNARPEASMRVAMLLWLGAAATAFGQGQTSTVREGEALYREHCASCHDGSVPRAPRRDAMARLSAESVRLTLTSGSMQAQASGLTPQQV